MTNRVTRRTRKHRRIIIHMAPVIMFMLVDSGDLAAENSVKTPPYLSGDALAGFEEYADYSHERAFAVSPKGAWGYAYGHNSLDEAHRVALANCRNYASHCKIIAENDRVIAPEYPFETAPTTSQKQSKSPLAFTEALDFSTVVLITGAGLILLLVGVNIARRYPVTYHFVYLPRTGEHYYLNWTLTPFIFVYLACMSPLLYRGLNDGLTDIMSWILFVAPLLPPPVATLYLHARGALVHIHRQ